MEEVESTFLFIDFSDEIILELECNLSLNLEEELDISDCGEFKLE